MTNDKSNQFKVGTDERGKGLVKAEEQAIIIGLILPNQTEEQVLEYFDELEFLALTAGAKTIKRFTQRLAHPDTRLFVGKGKLEEIAAYVQSHPDVTMAILDAWASRWRHPLRRWKSLSGKMARWPCATSV